MVVLNTDLHSTKKYMVKYICEYENKKGKKYLITQNFSQN